MLYRHVYHIEILVICIHFINRGLFHYLYNTKFSYFIYCILVHNGMRWKKNLKINENLPKSILFAEIMAGIGVFKCIHEWLNKIIALRSTYAMLLFRTLPMDLIRIQMTIKPDKVNDKIMKYGRYTILFIWNIKSPFTKRAPIAWAYRIPV